MRRERPGGIFSGLLVALSLLLMGRSADQRPSEVEATLANRLKDVVMPIQARDQQNPLPASEEILQQG